jgi:leader peptidase (prepilin peptidase)/N-methyltransferase
MGLGDAKLMAMLGAWLGWQRTLLSFVLGIFLAAAFALILLFRGNPDEHDDSTKPQWALKQLPFGSFLCIAGLVSYFFGGKLIALYLSAVGF